MLKITYLDPKGFVAYTECTSGFILQADCHLSG